MYIHIVPSLFHLMANKCHLESISIPEIGFNVSGSALSTGRPWPNKNLLVGMRNSSKAINGLLLKTDKKLKWFTAEFKWNIENMGVTTHRVTSYVEDEDFDLVSQDIMLNHGFDKWEPRIHSAYENMAPVKIQPKMESFITKPGAESHDQWVEYEWGNFLQSREESLLLHTIQSERLNTQFSLFERFPSFENVIDLD